MSDLYFSCRGGFDPGRGGIFDRFKQVKPSEGHSMDRAKATADLELEMESRTRRVITCNHSLLTMLQPVLWEKRTQIKALAQGAFKIEDNF